MTTQGDSKFIDYYRLLGIKPNAELPDIRRAFIAKAKEAHPDAGGSTEIMQQLNLAYKTLMSPTAKGSYDLMHSFHDGTTKPSDYRYQSGREVNEVDDMSDTEIDSFLDSLFDEYRHGPPKLKTSAKQRLKRLFDI